MVEVRALRLFVAVAEELHFGRTADRFGISQSMLSAQIMRIEDQIGIRLFDRGRRSAVALTTAGGTFLVEVRLALAQLDRAERIGRMAGRGEAGPVRIGFVMSAALSGCLPAALTIIRTQLPAIKVDALSMDSPDQIAAVSNGEIDLGFIRPRSTYPDNVAARVVHREDMLVVLAAGHPLASEKRIAPEALASETFIFPQFPDSDRFRQIAEDVSSISADEGRALVTRDFASAVSLAAAGYGIVISPRSLAGLGIPGVALRELDKQSEQVELALIWREGWNPRLMGLLQECRF